MSGERKNQDIIFSKDNKKNPYYSKENTTEISENINEPGYTLKSSNYGIDSQNNNPKTSLCQLRTFTRTLPLVSMSFLLLWEAFCVTKLVLLV